MEINGKTKLMGLIGNPVEHTLSPVIHNTIASCMNENMAYLPFPVKEDLDNAVKGVCFFCMFWTLIQGKSLINKYMPFERDQQRHSNMKISS